jgi:hypothetical protein
MRREIADRRLTEGSSFADSSELTSKTAALFSLMAEAVLDLAPPDTRRILSAGDSPFYEDTVLRRGIEVAFERLRRGQEPFEVISARIGEVAVFEVGEYESCPDEVADSAGAGGGVFQGVPSAGEQGEAAFALGA